MSYEPSPWHVDFADLLATMKETWQEDPTGLVLYVFNTPVPQDERDRFERILDSRAAQGGPRIEVTWSEHMLETVVEAVIVKAS